MKTKNPESKSINQKQGPRTGNAGTAEKRATFVKEKSATGSERGQLADFVMNALTARGTATRSSINPGVEGLDSNRGPKRNPTADGAKLPGRYKSPKTRG